VKNRAFGVLELWSVGNWNDGLSDTGYWILDTGYRILDAGY